MKMTDADSAKDLCRRFDELVNAPSGGSQEEWSEWQCDAAAELLHVAARLAADQQKGGGEVVYQVKLNGPIDAWVDTTESQFALAEDHEKRRRKLYTTPQPSIPAPAKQEVIETLLQLAYRAWCLADDTERLRAQNALSAELDKLDVLPDAQPGYTMEAAAKARRALRDLLAHPPHADQETQG